MRILILTHPRSGGLSLMKFISSELNYKFYHEPFFGNGDGLSDENINSILLVNDNIVVKDFPFRIIERGYNLYDVISKFDKVIIHKRDVAISLSYFEFTNNGDKMHLTYKLDDEWVKNNQEGIDKMFIQVKDMYSFIEDISIKVGISTTYDGLYNDKSEIPKLLEFLNIIHPRFLDILHNRHRLQNGIIGMDYVNVKPTKKKLI